MFCNKPCGISTSDRKRSCTDPTPMHGGMNCTEPSLESNECTTFGSKVQNLQISHGYIFRILQHFATTLYNFTNFNMLFLVVMDFVLLA